ncbi:MAG: Gfo/Idh/MocA family oxidoreductase [Chitinophagales bacterium]|nr:Gfo/Idh/MocA family oxidoreductase [Chitinophagales bacterium]
MQRRKFIKDTSKAAAIVMMAPSVAFIKNYQKAQIKLGFIGVGARGLSTLYLALRRDDIVVTTICDIDPITIKKALEMIEKAGKPKPEVFTGSDYAYKSMLEFKNLDAVIISTPWEWHTPMSIDAMQAGKAVGCEVAGAMSLDECWQMVRTQERTKVPFMVLENVCYRRDVMAILNMTRQNMFGELVHFEGGYQHDLREVKFNDGVKYYGGGVEFGDKGYSEAQWRTTHSVYRNGDLYPTHGIGPIGSIINNNRGNRFEYLTSMSSKARGLHEYIVNHPQGGPSHPNANVKFRLGDIVTTHIMTSNGETITLTHDTNLPRPYSIGFRVQGTKGLWMDVNKSIYIEGKSPAHRWEEAESYLKTYDHPLWKKYEDQAAGAGHGGMDWFVLNAFVEALKRDEPMPLDVYDHASWAAITCLSEQSIAQGSEPQPFPDFTDGKWMTRKPIFALNDVY